MMIPKVGIQAEGRYVILPVARSSRSSLNGGPFESEESVLDHILGTRLVTDQQQGHAEQREAMRTEEAGAEIVCRLPVARPGYRACAVHGHRPPALRGHTPMTPLEPKC
jgi:hypothetical protein